MKKKDKQIILFQKASFTTIPYYNLNKLKGQIIIKVK